MSRPGCRIAPTPDERTCMLRAVYARRHGEPLECVDCSLGARRLETSHKKAAKVGTSAKSRARRPRQAPARPELRALARAVEDLRKGAQFAVGLERLRTMAAPELNYWEFMDLVESAGLPIRDGRPRQVLLMQPLAETA